MQDQDNQKNLLIAIVLSMAVLFAWQFFFAAPREQERQARIKQEQALLKEKEKAPAPGTPGTSKTDQSQAPGAAPVASAPDGTILKRPEALALSKGRVGVETPSLKGSIALTGGRIDDLVLAKYRETVDPKSPNVEMFSPSRSPQPYYAEFGWTAGKGVTQPMPNDKTEWKVEKGGTLTPDSPVTLAWDNGQGLLFRRTISVDRDYLFKVEDEVENKSANPVALSAYALISRHGLPKLDGVWMILHEGFIGAVGESGLKEVNYADVLKEGGTKTYKQTGGWLGLADKYWAAALIPDPKVPTEAHFGGTKAASGAAKDATESRDRYQADVVSEIVEIAPGSKGGFSSHLFAGAKVVSLIDKYNAELGAPQTSMLPGWLARIVYGPAPEQQPHTRQFNMLFDWGYFWFLTQPIYMLLHWFAQLLGNYGLAILATTVVVKAIFFPLANKSYESMAKMKLLQPEMEKLRERHKDDRAKMQQELMLLYKEKKINPMAGCLPIVLQIPVFFALYKVLYLNIDMRHAPFLGWIKDLSAPDPTSIFNLFGLLPYATPEFLHVGVWPIIMGITMWVQMQLNPQQADPMQQRIFNWMPVMFTFLLANFASGLVIYWAWNNLLSLTQQYFIMTRNGAEIHLWKNIGVDKLIARLGSGQSGASQPPRATAPERGTAAERPAQPVTTADGSDNGPVPAPKPIMTREQALKTLGLAPGASAAQIEAAYKVRARQKGGLNGSSRLSQAREVLRGEGT
jgi:YidC/Oxa1 family membrane protein insertase